MHAKAEGPLKKLVFFLVALVVVIAVGTYLIPFSAEYEVKTAAKVACNEYRMSARGGNADDRSWETKFVARARVAGVQLREDQYNFTLSNDFDDATCRIQIKWIDKTTAILIGDIVTELPPLTILHSIDYVHRVKKKY